MRRYVIVVLLSCLALIAAAGLSGKAAQAPAGGASPPPSLVPLPLDARSNVDSLVGWASGPAVKAERMFEDAFLAMPSADGANEIEQHLSSTPHRAGTPADYATAMYVRDKLNADGFETTIVPFEVSYTNPTHQELAILGPTPEELDLLEGEPGHHTPQETAAGPTFMEASGDGDVSGPIFYLNHGFDEDFDAFDKAGLTMPPGSIVLVRWGRQRDPHGNARFYDQLMKRKVAGLIEYPDAGDDGFVRGETWPKGNFKNENMSERIGGLRPSSPADPPGDPTLPGQAPLPGVPHLAFDAIPHSTIPEMDVTQRVARALLAQMDGPVVPDAWHGAFEMVEHIGGTERVHMAVTMERKIVTIWNVFGTLKGATQPDQTVVIGSHRDAMAFGAIDPGSGTTVMMQIADGYAKLMKQGWKPNRSIEIASWDGHELGLWGSISLAYAHGDMLRKHVVQYINTDQLTTGPPFVAAMSAGLWTFGTELAGLVKGLDGKPLIAADSPAHPVVTPPGGGSDHMTFIYMLGLPGTTTGYYGAFGAHHTAEDNIPGIQTYDPGYKEAVITAQFTGVQAMRAAGGAVPPLRVSEVPTLMLHELTVLAKDPRMEGIDFSTLRARLITFRSAALSADKKVLAAERGGDVATMHALFAKEEAARIVFYEPGGLTFNKYWHTIDRLVAPFPEISYASYETSGKAGALKTAIDRLTAATERGTAALQGT
jgi:N-acetylated-alpha-linked acidic dipeptidase